MKQPDPEYVRSSVFELTPRWTDRYKSEVQTRVKLKLAPSVLEISFEVKEDQIRALETDPWLVHRDSCVEFFFRLPGEKDYYNFEVNPVGNFLFAVGTGRNNRKDLTYKFEQSIRFEGSYVGYKPFEITGSAWSIKFQLLSTMFGYSSWEPIVGDLKGNLYKCGDGLVKPHYLSWAPLSSVDPDFHRPRDFRVLLSARDSGLTANR